MRRKSLTHERIFSGEEFAAKYAKKHKKMAEKFGLEFSQKLKSRGFHKGRILDAGCGFGGTAIFLAHSFPESDVCGIDLSEPLLRLANRSAEQSGVKKRATFEPADVHRLPYEDDSFDVVLNVNMLHIVDNPVRMLDEIERVLKAQGLLFIADLRRSWLGRIEKEITSSYTLVEAKELFSRSTVRKGKFSSSMIWWRFEA